MSAFGRAYVVPGLPHPLLAPEQNSGWAALRRAFDAVRRELETAGIESLVLYSTQWTSIIGHQIQADPHPEWVLVDPEWHELGSMPYRFRMDPELASAYRAAATKRGLRARTVAYRGFPIDTGSVVALRLLDPENRMASTIVSCNMYSDRAETLVLGKAAADAVRATGRKAAAIAVTALSNRLITQPMRTEDDRISSLKDDEWNRKILEILGRGRLEDVCDLAREFTQEANADQKMKAFWWLAAAAGRHNSYDAEVMEYQPIMGTGAAVVRLLPNATGAAQLEFDEDDVETFRGERSVLAAQGESAPAPAAPPLPATKVVTTASAARPVGAYPHARRVGDLLFLSGIGPRRPGTDEIPGGPVRTPAGEPQTYDFEAQVRSVFDNVQAILEAAGGGMGDVLDVTVFLIDMERDFPTFNRLWAERLGAVGATRTTLAVQALPKPIAIELKVIAAARTGSEVPA